MYGFLGPCLHKSPIVRPIRTRSLVYYLNKINNMRGMHLITTVYGILGIHNNYKLHPPVGVIIDYHLLAQKLRSWLMATVFFNCQTTPEPWYLHCFMFTIITVSNMQSTVAATPRFVRKPTEHTVAIYTIDCQLSITSVSFEVMWLEACIGFVTTGRMYSIVIGKRSSVLANS